MKINLNQYNIQEKASVEEASTLLRELEKEAEQRFKNAVRVGDMNIDCVLHVYQDYASHLSANIHYILFYSINEKKIEIKKSVRDDIGMEDFVKELIETFSASIAVELLGNPFHKAMKENPYIRDKLHKNQLYRDKL